MSTASPPLVRDSAENTASAFENHPSPDTHSAAGRRAAVPLKTQHFFVTGGTVPFDAVSYVTRKADTDLLAALMGGEFCYVLNSRQMGKSSLSVRTVARLREHRVRTAFLDLTKIGGQNAQPEQFYAGLFSELGRALGLRREMMVHYRDRMDVPAPLRLVSALREVALEADASPLVVFVDEVDAVRSLPFPADELFTAIRACHNARTEDPAYNRLTFCLVGSATPGDLIRDSRTSPFNVGRRIELRDFTPEEAAPLAEGLPGGKTALARVLHWTNGHPYLTQAVCADLAAAASPQRPSNAVVDAAVAALFFETSARSRNPNLADVANRVLRRESSDAAPLSDQADAERRSALLSLYEKVLRGRPSVPDDETDELLARLKLSGVTRSEGGRIRVRCPIYTHVFDRRWIEENLPGAELRRQKEAYRRGIFRATALSGAVAVGFALLSLIAVRNATRARELATRANNNAIQAAENAHRADENASKADKNANRAEKSEQLARSREQYAKQQTALARRNEDTARSATKQAKIEAQRATAALADARRARSEAEMSANAARQAAGGERTARTLADKAARRADQFARNAVQAAKQAQHTAYSAQMVSVRHNWDGEQIEEARNALNNDVIKKAPPEIRGFEWGYWQHTLHAQQRSFPDEGAISGVAVSPNGTVLALTGEAGVSLWNLHTGHFLRRFAEKEGGSYRSVFSADGSRLATTGVAGIVQLWDVASGKALRIFSRDPASVRVALSPDGRILACPATGNRFALLSADTGKMIRSFPVSGKIEALVFSPDGVRIATGEEDHAIRLWDVSTGQEVRRFEGHTAYPFRTLAFSPNSRFLAAPTDEGIARIWDVETGRESHTLQRYSEPLYPPMTSSIAENGTSNEKVRGHRGPISDAAFSPDGGRFATCGLYDGSVRIWNLATSREMQTIHTASPRALAFSSNGKGVVAGSLEGTARLWRVPTPNPDDPPENMKEKELGVFSLAFDPQGERLLVGQRGGAMAWRDAGQEDARYTAFPATSYKGIFALSPDGTQAATGDENGMVLVRDVRTGRLLRRLETGMSGAFIRNIAFSPDHRRLAAMVKYIKYAKGTGNGDVVLWDARTGMRLFRRPVSGNTLQFSADGTYFFVAEDVMNFATLMGKFSAHRSSDGTAIGLSGALSEAMPGVVGATAASPDGTLIAMASTTDAQIRLFKVDANNSTNIKGNLRHILSSPRIGMVWALAFSPDGRRLAAAGRDGSVRLYDVTTGSEVLYLSDVASSVESVAFSSDGRRIACGYLSGAVRVWESATTALATAWAKADSAASERFTVAKRRRAAESDPLAENPALLAEIKKGVVPDALPGAPNLFDNQGWKPMVFEDTIRNEVTATREKDGSVRLNVKKADGVMYRISLSRRNLLMPPSHRYVLQFRARADRPRALTVRAANQYPPYDDIGLQNENVLLTERWRGFRFPFTIGKNAVLDQSVVSIMIGGVASTVWVDNIRLVELKPDAERTALEDADEQKRQRALDYAHAALLAEIQRGVVPDALPRAPNLFDGYDWKPVSIVKSENEATATREKDGSVRVDVTKTDGTPFHIMFGLSHLTLIPGHRYVLQFRARDSRTRTATVRVQSEVRPKYESLGLGVYDLRFTPKWRGFRYVFTVNQNAAPGKGGLRLYFGDSVGSTWLANMRLVEIKPESADTPPAAAK